MPKIREHAENKHEGGGGGKGAELLFLKFCAKP